jgi:hypothetical protein
VLAGVCLFAKPTKFIDLMVSSLVAAITINYYGAMIYIYGLSPVSYNMAFSILYFIIACIFFTKERDNEMSKLGGLCVPYRKCYSFFCSLCEKAKA